MSATRAKRIHEVNEITTLDVVGSTDQFVVDRQDGSGNWENKRISAANAKAQLSSAAAVVAGEDSIQDGQVIEMFDDYSLGAISSFTKGTGWLNNGVGTGCSIVSRTMADGRTQKRLSISAGQYGRTLPWGKYWNRLKIILLWRLNHTAQISPVDGYVGVCSGTTNMVASATTANYIGLRWADGLSTLTFNAGTLINYFSMGATFCFFTRRGTTSTIIAGGGSGHTLPATEGYLAPIIFEVSRPPAANDAASILYSVKEASPPVALAESSRTKDLMKGLLQSSSGSTVSLSELETATIGNGGNSSVSFDQSTGGFDTVNFSWPHVPGLEIAALGVRKVH